MALSVTLLHLELSPLRRFHFCDGPNHVLQVTDWLSHVPKEVLAKNFQLDVTAFDQLPGASQELFIFPSSTFLNTYTAPIF